MDFAAAMSAQISKSKGSKGMSGKDSAVASAKYQRRAEIESARESAYHAEQAAREKERLQKQEQKRKLEEEEAEKARGREAKRKRIAEGSKELQKQEEERAERERRKRIGLPEVPKQGVRAEDEANHMEDPSEGSTMMDHLSDAEVIAKLREMDEPSRLFGELNQQRLLRLSKISRARSATPGGSVAPRSKDPIPTSIEPVAEKDMKVSSSLPPVSDPDAREFLARQLTSWFNLVLREWAIALLQRPDDVKRSFSGQAATNSHAQALSHLKPLFRKLEKCIGEPGELPDDLFKPIADIVRAAQERRYVEANDQYLQLSIGKAAWPIGVTMVGIHERSAREKLHESDKSKSHIMGDEQTRKILQSIKRCLSFAQTKWPPEDLGQLMG